MNQSLYTMKVFYVNEEMDVFEDMPFNAYDFEAGIHSQITNSLTFEYDDKLMFIPLESVKKIEFIYTGDEIE